MIITCVNLFERGCKGSHRSRCLLWSWRVKIGAFTKINNFFLKIFSFCFVNSKKVFTFVHSSKFISYGIKNCLSQAVKPSETLSA